MWVASETGENTGALPLHWRLGESAQVGPPASLPSPHEDAHAMIERRIAR
jgi:hypothetical protein